MDVEGWDADDAGSVADQGLLWFGRDVAHFVRGRLEDASVLAAARAHCSLPRRARGGASLRAGNPTVVASVYDGDTLTLTSGKRVRLLQIDTPELGSGECYSRAARTALLSLTPVGSRVVLEADRRSTRWTGTGASSAT